LERPGNRRWVCSSGEYVKLSKRSEYAIKAAVRLAHNWGRGYLQSREIAEQEQLPSKFIESILLAMRSGGFLESKVGVGGGYRLRMPPEQIRIAELIAVMEQSTEVIHEASPKPSVGEQAMQVLNARLAAAIDEAFGGLDLAQLIAEHPPKRGAASSATSMYHI
jgi:Rrf2 family protein